MFPRYSKAKYIVEAEFVLRNTHIVLLIGRSQFVNGKEGLPDIDFSIIEDLYLVMEHASLRT